MSGIDLFRLNGKVALVTGGSKGLGRSMATGFAAAGSDVVICSRNADEVKRVADLLRETTGRKIIGLRCDVTDPEEVNNLVEETMDRMGKLDILVNNAGINIRNPIEKLSLKEFEQVMNVNVCGPWLCSRAVIPHMKASGYGRVINIASTVGVVGLPGRTPYASSKGALIQMTRVLALEWASEGITANAICPGPFITPMNEPIINKPDGQRLIETVPMARWGELEEIQGAAIFLASEASSYITGSTLFVDGGWTAH